MHDAMSIIAHRNILAIVMSLVVDKIVCMFIDFAKVQFYLVAAKVCVYKNASVNPYIRKLYDAIRFIDSAIELAFSFAFIAFKW